MSTQMMQQTIAEYFTHSGAAPHKSLIQTAERMKRRGYDTDEIWQDNGAGARRNRDFVTFNGNEHKRIDWT